MGRFYHPRPVDFMHKNSKCQSLNQIHITACKYILLHVLSSAIYSSSHKYDYNNVLWPLVLNRIVYFHFV